MSDMTIPEYDARQAEYEFTLKQVQLAEVTRAAERKQQRVLARHRTYEYAIPVAAVLIFGVLLLTYLFHPWYQRPPQTPRTNPELAREETCINNGGGWVPKDLLNDYAEQGLCVYPGKRATQ